jgi:hypothetical protein
MDDERADGLEEGQPLGASGMIIVYMAERLS